MKKNEELIKIKVPLKNNDPKPLPKDQSSKELLPK